MWVFADANVGRKNIVFGIALFLIAGIGLGIPLTIDFLGGSTLGDLYQPWKVVHGYAIFLSFINYFVGLSLDRWNLTPAQKQIVSWSFLVTGLIGGVTRMILVGFGALDALGIYASLGESAFITLGTAVFVLGQWRSKRYPAARPVDSGIRPAKAASRL